MSILETKRFIVLDLELEQPFTNHQTPDSKTPVEKIIQLGFVVLELGTEPKFLHEEVIHLAYTQPISEYIKKLTSIDQNNCLQSDIEAYGALRRLKDIREALQCSRQLVQWGGGDDSALATEANADLNKDFGFARSSINVKHLFQMYCLANDIKGRGGLSKSMGKLNVPFVNTRYNGVNKGAHWALTDAKNTAIIFNELMKLIKTKE